MQAIATGSCIQSLSLDQPGKRAALFDQFLIGPFFGDLSVFDQKDPVAITDRAEAVGNDNAGAAQAVQGFGNLFLGLVVQGTGGLIQDQNIRFGSNCARDHQTLLLTSRNASGTLGNNRVHSHRHLADILCNACCFGRFPGLFQGQVRRGDRDIGKDIALEKLAVLGNDTHLFAQRAGIDPVPVLPTMATYSPARIFRERSSKTRGLSFS